MNKCKINVLIYEPTSGYGGSSKCLNMLLKYIDKQVFYPFVLYKNKTFHLDKNTTYKIINLNTNNWENSLTGINGCLSGLFVFIKEILIMLLLIVRYNIQIIHINTNINSSISMILAGALLRRPIICHIRETRELIKREKYLQKFVTQFIVINNDALTIYSKYIPKNKIKVISDGVDFTEFENPYQVLRFQYDVKDNFLVGLIGRIVEGKGQKEFVLAVKEVCKTIDNILFFIVGDAKGEDNKYCSTVKKIVEENNLENKIIFTGWRDDIKNVIYSLDLVVQGTTTFPEGFGLTIVEAMALKKPVLATMVSGPNEIVIDTKTGFLVEPGDTKGMAEKIIYFYKNPQDRIIMGENGYNRVIECYDIQENVKKIQSVYWNLLK